MADIAEGEPKVRRWTEQRWALDNVLRSVGIDWDQPRSFYLNAACGIEGGADFAAIRERVKKYADIEPAFANTARRREGKARAAEEDGAPVTARDNYFMAAIHWGSAQWSHYDNDATNLAYNKSKRDCYTNYVRLADHKIEPVMIPFKGKTLPGWFHLPPNYTGGRIPVVISFPGMDTYKEVFVALKGDRWLERGIAVLALDGPGQAECRVLGLTVSMENWTAVGKAAVDWLMARPRSIRRRSAPSATASARFSSPSWPRTSRASAPALPIPTISSRASTRSSRRRARPTRSALCTWRASPTRRSSMPSAGR
jgi:hypothetical protein